MPAIEDTLHGSPNQTADYMYFTCKVSVSLEQPGNVSHASWQVFFGTKGFGYKQSLQVITDVNWALKGGTSILIVTEDVLT